jgi:hypothetical protein
MICPICNKNVQLEIQVETPCECCKSIIYQNEKSECFVIKPMVKFSTTNFVSGLLGSIVYLAFTVYLINKNVNLILIGLTQGIATGLVFLIQYTWYKSDEFQGFFDLLKALKGKRLRYYDWGSKFFIISLFAIAAIEFGLLITGLIIYPAAPKNYVNPILPVTSFAETGKSRASCWVFKLTVSWKRG